MDLRKWIKSLLMGALTGACTMLISYVDLVAANPEMVNKTGFWKIVLIKFLAGSIMGALLYLKQSPLPTRG